MTTKISVVGISLQIRLSLTGAWLLHEILNYVDLTC